MMRYNTDETLVHVEKGRLSVQSCMADVYISNGIYCNGLECMQCIDNPLTCRSTEGIITARQHSLRCISHSKFVRLSVRLTVCHTLAMSQNDSSYDHGVFTGG